MPADLDVDGLDPVHPWSCTATTAAGNRCSQQAASRDSSTCAFHLKQKAGLYETQPGRHNGT
jgi:hypothetical protein